MGSPYIIMPMALFLCECVRFLACVSFNSTLNMEHAKVPSVGALLSPTMLVRVLIDRAGA